MTFSQDWCPIKMCKCMNVVCVSHPQPCLDVLGVKLCPLSYLFSSTIGRKKMNEEVDLLRVVIPYQLMQ